VESGARLLRLVPLPECKAIGLLIVLRQKKKNPRKDGVLRLAESKIRENNVSSANEVSQIKNSGM